MKIKLLLSAIAAVALLAVCSVYQLTTPGDFPEKQELLTLLETAEPQYFWEELLGSEISHNIDTRYISTALRVFDEISGEMTKSQRKRLNAVEGFLLLRMGFYHAAESRLKYSLSSSRKDSDSIGILLALETIYTIQNRESELESIKQSIAELHSEKLTETQLQATETVEPESFIHSIIILVLWVFLLFLPFVAVGNERWAWMDKYSEYDDLRGPYLAFFNSVLPEVLILLSATIALILDLPTRMGNMPRFWFIPAHIIISWIFCQWPVFKIEKYVKKTKSWFVSFLREKLLIFIFTHIHLTALVLAVTTVYLMIDSVPLWALLRPPGALFSLPTLFAGYVILLELLLPWIFWLKKIKLGFPHRSFKAGGTHYKGVIEYGSMSFTATQIFFGKLSEAITKEETELLCCRSQRRFKSNSYFVDFLISINFVVIISLFYSLGMLYYIRFFSLGPTFIQALSILTIMLLCGWFRNNLMRGAHIKVDESFNSYQIFEELISLLEKTNRLNYVPDHTREGEKPLFEKLSLQEVRNTLRSVCGIYYAQNYKPDADILVSLWRSRLAIEWNMGKSETVFVTSLDYQVSSSNRESELCALASRHAAFGAECLYRDKLEQLNIIYCCQKMSADTVDPPLPKEKICSICSEAMLKSLQHGPYSWYGNSKGCVIKYETLRHTQKETPDDHDVVL